MKICVPIKQVPEPDKTKMDEKTGRIIREGVRSVINPIDLYAIEKAIRLREEKGGTVTVLSMGPRNAEEAIREAIAMGCDAGLLVSDAAFGGSDTWATSYVLSHAIRKAGPFDLVLCGERAVDGETGQVGPGLAAFLELPLITYAADILLREGKVVVKRLTEDRYEVYECPPPLVVTVVKEISDPRLPTLAGKKRARAAEIPVLSAKDLPLEPGCYGLAGSPTRVGKIFRPSIRREGEVLQVKKPDDARKAVERIMEYLEANDLIRSRT